MSATAERPTKKREQEQRDFIARLSLMKDEAMRLGLVRTAHAFSHARETFHSEEAAGPLTVAGYELADILRGRQVQAPGVGRLR